MGVRQIVRGGAFGSAGVSPAGGPKARIASAAAKALSCDLSHALGASRSAPRRVPVDQHAIGPRAVLACGLAAPLLLGCGHERYDGRALGTTFAIQGDCALPRRAVDRVLADVNRQMSTFQQNSELMAFNRAAVGKPVPVSAQLVDVVAAAGDVAAQTGGAFDVTVAPLVGLWGFGAQAGRTPPTAAQIHAARAQVGHARVGHQRDPPRLVKLAPVTVDLSGIAKGHAVDALAGVLDRAGCGAFLIEIGGEIRVAGASPGGGPWRVGVDHPRRRGGHLAVLKLKRGAIATSGGYRQRPRFGDAASAHVIDPRTGRPVRHATVSATVVAATARRADALATALLVMGASDGLAFAARHEVAALFATSGAGGALAVRQSPAMAEYR